MLTPAAAFLPTAKAGGFSRRFGEYWINVDPTTRRLAEDHEIPVEYHGAFDAFCIEYLIEHDEYPHESGIFWGGDNPLNDIINKWYSFYRPIADAVENNLGNQVCLDVYVEPSYLATTTIIITASNKDGKETLVYRCRKNNWDFIKKEVLLETLETCYNSIFSGAKVLVKDKILTGDEIRVVFIDSWGNPNLRRISNTTEKLQNLVGGYTELIPLEVENETNNYSIVVCKDGKERGNRLNIAASRALNRYIYGNVVVTKLIKGKFVSLTKEEGERISSRYS